ncbi:MAG: hypothetical protein EXS31_02665 [Pedosphaera sp.]|nr:hypothetical protein [Pedosphaera sp.]
MKMETDTKRFSSLCSRSIACAMFVAFAWSANAAVENGKDAPSTNKAAVTSTNAPAIKAPPTDAPTARDYASFKLINDRNIFNPNRTKKASRGDRERSRAAVTESFTLVGTMSSSKGDRAFFDGSSSSYKKVLKPGDAIGGHKITAIDPHAVQLEKDGNTVELAVGAQMKRQDDDPWKVTASTLVLASEPKSATDTKADSGGTDDDVLKRLQKKREEELNK